MNLFRCTSFEAPFFKSIFSPRRGAGLTRAAKTRDGRELHVKAKTSSRFCLLPNREIRVLLCTSSFFHSSSSSRKSKKVRKEYPQRERETDPRERENHRQNPNIGTMAPRPTKNSQKDNYDQEMARQLAEAGQQKELAKKGMQL